MTERKARAKATDVHLLLASGLQFSPLRQTMGPFGSGREDKFCMTISLGSVAVPVLTLAASRVVRGWVRYELGR
jgi:hypothetical protein